jgi:hypothetical protein
MEAAMRLRNQICALFIFSLTASALAEKLHVAEMPHVHQEVIKPELTLSLPSASASGGSGRLIVDVEDQMPEMQDRVRTSLAW